MNHGGISFAKGVLLIHHLDASRGTSHDTDAEMCKQFNKVQDADMQPGDDIVPQNIHIAHVLPTDNPQKVSPGQNWVSLWSAGE